jgi:uncharacterized protein YdiU (UPF0061 family)
LAVALRLLAEAEPLLAAMNRFGELYMAAIARRWCWRLGVQPRSFEPDTRLVASCEKVMRESAAQPDAFFFAHRGGRNASGELAEILRDYEAVDDSDPYWQGEKPQSMLIDEVEAIWSAIAEHDDWSPLHTKIEAVRRMGAAHGEPPGPANVTF